MAFKGSDKLTFKEQQRMNQLFDLIAESNVLDQQQVMKEQRGNRKDVGWARAAPDAQNGPERILTR
jgi:hypothetical protein